MFEIRWMFIKSSNPKHKPKQQFARYFKGITIQGKYYETRFEFESGRLYLDDPNKNKRN